MPTVQHQKAREMNATANKSAKVKERPMSFKGPMVRGIIERRKTQTRRTKGLDYFANTTYANDPDRIGRWECRDGVWCFWEKGSGGSSYPVYTTPCPYGVTGDRIWVKESFYIDDIHYQTGSLKERPADIVDEQIYYRADGECCQQIPECACAEVGMPRWRPPMFMPRWASRITLEITDIRVERLQQMDFHDWKADFCPSFMQVEHALASFVGQKNQVQMASDFWDSINGDTHPWRSNPFVWVIHFHRVS